MFPPHSHHAETLLATVSACLLLEEIRPPLFKFAPFLSHGLVLQLERPKSSFVATYIGRCGGSTAHIAVVVETVGPVGERFGLFCVRIKLFARLRLLLNHLVGFYSGSNTFSTTWTFVVARFYIES